MAAEDGREITALVIPAQSRPYLKRSKWDLNELQGAVGGYIESLPHTYERHVIYGNDEAKYAGEDGGPLPLNVRATEALRHMLLPGDFIAGDVVVLGADRDGYEKDIDPRLAEELQSGELKIVSPEGILVDI